MAKLKKLKELGPDGEQIYVIREYPTKKVTKKQLLQLKAYLTREIEGLQDQMDKVDIRLAEIDELED
jgi:hypothetical protein